METPPPPKTQLLDAPLSAIGVQHRGAVTAQGQGEPCRHREVRPGQDHHLPSPPFPHRPTTALHTHTRKSYTYCINYI